MSEEADFHHKLRKWLYDSYEFEEGESTAQPEILQHLQASLGSTVKQRLITALIAKEFPEVCTKRVRTKEDWKIKCVNYMNLTRKRPNQTIENYQLILKEAGFTIVEDKGSVNACLPTELIVNGKRLCKEINVDEEGNVIVKVDGKVVPESPSRICRKEMSSWRVLTKEVREMKMCEGYVTEGKEGSELWESVGGGEKRQSQRMHARSCRVALPADYAKNACQKCLKSCRNSIQREKNEIEEEVDFIDDHDDSAFIDVVPQDHDDLYQILQKLKNDPNFKDNNLVDFIQIQMSNRIRKEPRSRRWPLSFIQYCLSCWATSPACYNNMAKQDYLLLPSGRLLQYYKNSMRQTPGINPDLFGWMVKEADAKKIPAAGRSGCLALDEVKIQSDIMMQPEGQNFKLVGFLDAGSYCNDLHFLKTGLLQPQLAQFVLQFVFVGHTGFKFPVAHWPSNEANAAELDDHLEEVMDTLLLYGFTVDAILTDGACSNRALVKLHFEGHPRKHLYTIPDPLVLGHKKVFISDPSHLVKKIRNSLLKSQCSSEGTRFLQRNEDFIFWDYWQEAESWDSDYNTGHRVHHKLTASSVDVNKASKMRNSFAFEALNTNMLHLMKEYQSYLGPEGGDHLNLTVTLLKHSASLCQLFQSSKPLNSVLDPLLVNAENALKWFQDWEISVNNDTGLTKKEKWRALLSWECREDLESTVIGIKQLVEIRNSAFPSNSITPILVNSDCVENIFCQVRSVHNGANDNPTYLQYLYTLNTIMLSAGLFKKNSNAGCNALSAMPFKCAVPGPLNPNR